MTKNSFFLGRDFEYSPEVFPFVVDLLEKASEGKKEISFFEFGTGSGLDAREIALILSQREARKVGIYGYDPNSDPVEEVTLLLPEDIDSGLFDIFLAKWVLHHVPPECRWQDLSTFYNECCSKIILSASSFDL